MTKSFEDQVREFHEKYEFPVDERLASSDRSFDGDQAIRAVGSMISVVEYTLKTAVNTDLRAARAHLIVEEVGELIQAFKDGDEVAVADAVADLCYVVVGTAVAYGLPLEALFAEVHRSNMSKDVDGNHKPKKGDGFTPPDIEGVLKNGRVVR